MSLSKPFQFFGTLASLLSPALVTFASLPPQLPAEFESKREVSLKFPNTSNREAPSSTASGGSRGINKIASCIEVDETTEPVETPLKALIPATYLTKTITDKPSLFVYVPKTTAESAKFIVRDNDGKEVYRSEFVPPETSGIVKLTIPETVSLAVKQKYQWQFTLMCNPKDLFAEENKFVEGLLLRTQLSSEQQKQLDCVRQAPNLENLLELPERWRRFSCVTQSPDLQNLLNSISQSPEQKELLNSLKKSPEQAKLYVEALVYANAEIWHETIDNIAQLREDYPDEWQELLESVGLDSLAQETLLDCCRAD